MEKESLVSIIIPVYNASKYIDDCLMSIINQSYKNIEVFLINDGSKDDSLQKLYQWQKKDSRIYVEDQINHGVSYTRNKGISLATGDYITFIDADDVVSLDFISVLVELIKNTGSDCAICNIKNFWSETDKVYSDGNATIYSQVDTITNLFGIFHGFMANKMYKLSIIQKHNIKLNEDIAISEDLLFNIDYMQYVSKSVYYSGIKYLYRQHGASAFNRLDNLKWFSVLDTMNILLAKFENNKYISQRISSTYMMLTFEGKYRLHYCNNISQNIINKIVKGEQYASRNLYSLPIKDIIKIIIMKTFPSFVMWYRHKKNS